jgi:hypothetical protein
MQSLRIGGVVLFLFVFIASADSLSFAIVAADKVVG